MTSLVDSLCFDANDPLRLARFWAGVLGWEMADDPIDGIALLPSDDTGFRVRFPPTQEQKTGPNHMHLFTVISNRRSTVSSPWGLLASTSTMGTSAGWSWLILMGMSSVC